MSEHYISWLQNWYCQNVMIHTKFNGLYEMGIQAQACTKRQLDKFILWCCQHVTAIPSQSGQLIAWLQTRAQSTIQTLSHHSFRDWGKPPKTSVRITTDSAEIQTGYHPNKNQKPTCDWQIMTSINDDDDDDHDTLLLTFVSSKISHSLLESIKQFTQTGPNLKSTRKCWIL